MKRRWWLTRVSALRRGCPDGFLSITENWYFLAGNLAHKSAESAILTGDVFPAVSTTGTSNGEWNE
jgi:hypothetical protein